MLKRSCAEQLPSDYKKQGGVAIILVMFVVALASILVVNLAYSTYLGARLSSSVERSLQAEYLLKSALNLARVLIHLDVTPDDAPDDPWALFKNGAPIPLEWLGINEPNLRLELEIRPEDSKIPIHRLVATGGSPDLKWRGILTRLFKDKLGFDLTEEEDQTGLFPGRRFSSEELVAELIDYMDFDKNSYSDGAYQGIEKDLPDGYFPNRQMSREGELATIPGFTANRVRQLLPYVTTGPVARLNINSASALVLGVLHQDMDDNMVRSIVEFRSGPDGPFKDGQLQTQLQQFLAPDIVNEISPLLSGGSTQFQVLAKVDYGTSTYFLRAFLSKRANGTDLLPKIRSIELF